MRTFQQDFSAAFVGRKNEILERRKAQIDSLTAEFETSRGYRRRCLKDRIALLKEEYDEIASV